MEHNSPSINLVPELLSNICSNLDKPGLKLVRLVCKALDGAAVPMLFDRVYVASRYADLEVARLVAARFRPFIKTLVYCLESYPDAYTLKEFEEVVAEQSDHSENGHVRLNWETYCRLKREHEELTRSGEVFGIVCYLLGYLPHLRRIALSDRIRERTYCPCSQAILDCSVRTFDPVPIQKKYKFVPRKLNWPCRSHCFAAPSGFVTADGSPWHHIFHALFVASNAKIREIIVDPEDQSLGLRWEAFTMNPMQAYYARNVLPTLVKLKLFLSTRDFFGEIETEPDFGGLKRALPWASSLQDLEIEIYDGNRYGYSRECDLKASEQFSACLEDIDLPHLKTLSLSGFRLHEDSLVKTLSATRRVKHLSLNDVTLISGSWESLVERLRKILEIVDIEVSDLKNFPENESVCEHLAIGRYKELSRELEQYFRHGGRNPLEWYENESEDGF
ncbi:hypothetical protein G7Y79_00017g042100 [Physcia stellaris]|nr:hypothetical protein G7Y79_00017g042100 [Physcia stellaris]